MRLLVFIASTLGGAVATAQVQFTEVALDAGIGEDPYDVEGGHGLGVNWIDFDLDGRPDLFAVNGFDHVPHLFRNNGDGTFRRADALLPPLPNVEMMGSVFADYDRDGDPDLYVFTDNEDKEPNNDNPLDGPCNLLLKNLWVETGGLAEPLFVDVADAAGVGDVVEPPFGLYPAYRSSTGCFLDYDRDGWIDLYVAHWVCQESGSLANVDRLYRNDGDGTFTDVTAFCGIHSGADTLYLRPALAVIGAHLDGDLWPDLYVAHVTDAAPYHHDIHYRNTGAGSFTDVTADSPGIGDDSGAAMGVTIADIDGDGDWDLYMSDLYFSHDVDPRGNPLYLGRPDGTFSDNMAVEAGVQGDHSWGVNFLDVDHDGDDDLFVAAMYGQHNLLYVNQGDGTFADEAPGTAIHVAGDGRGSAYADYDGDGDLDIAMSYKDGRLHLFRNDTTTGHWLKVRLRGVRSNPDAIGAVVRVTAGAVTVMRQVIAGDSGHGQNALDLHFGLSEEPHVHHIEVRWPSGAVNHYHDVNINQHLELTETFTGDVNGDDAVDIRDVLALLTAWGPCACCPGCTEDIDGDGVVNTVDLLRLLEDWG